jgi:BCD family chlorophyll transporter-like MFS transporter
MDGRSLYNRFAVFNALSFNVLTGNVLILYILKLGAGTALLGLVSSFVYLAFFFMFAGRLLIGRLGAVRMLGGFILARNLAMIPALFGPLVVSRGDTRLALFLTIASAALFGICRGFAGVGDNPILAEIGRGSDRGAFLSRLSAISQVSIIASGLVAALYLGKEAPLLRYVLVMGMGIASGVVGSLFIFRIPEPLSSADSASEGFLASLARVWAQRNSRLFFVSIFLVHLATAVSAPFIIVYFRRIYALSEGSLVLVAGMANVGALLAAMVSGAMIDRLGTKPLYFGFTLASILALLMIVILPQPAPGLASILFASLVFLVCGAGMAGIANAALVSFFGMTTTRESINLGMIFYLLAGAGGSIGAITGGKALDLLLASPALAGAKAFRLYYGIAIGFFVLLAALVYRLPGSGSTRTEKRS